MRQLFAKHDYFIKVFLVLSVFVIGALGVLDLFDLGEDVKTGVRQGVEIIKENTVERTRVECDAECEGIIDDKVKEAVGEEQALSKSTARVTSAPTTKTVQTSYVAVGSTFSTRSTDWTDVPGQVVINPADYGSSQSFYFEISAKIGNSNGEVGVRLFDVTNSIAVSGAELSSNSASYTNVSSGSLPLWSGSNTYKVQIRSTSGEEASFASGRVKVSYK